uniref:Uncharacterized protein n=1 Tax=Anguilla anguilla TaxID=7936 RepID=A0A0E9Q4R7_ANGAN
MILEELIVQIQEGKCRCRNTSHYHTTGSINPPSASS